MKIDYSVYLVTDQFDYSQEEFLNIIEESLKGGTTIVQIREKHSSTKDFLDLARKVKSITDKYDVPLIINDRIDIALAIDSAGVHLGQDDMPCKIARKLLGSDKIIGISAENYEDALQAQLDGADYLGVGAIEPTKTKADCSVISHDDLIKISHDIHIPYVAIGGVKEYNTQEIINKYNFNGVAIVSAIMNSDNPRLSSLSFNKLVNNSSRNLVYSALYGVIVGDALGVPFEFNSRKKMDEHPATRMIGHGTYDKEAGTWSDDSSLSLALADSLCDGIDYNDIMSKFYQWLYHDKYTPSNETFDVGNTTLEAIDNYHLGFDPLECGGSGKHDNGNGSLMRIMPILLYIHEKSIDFNDSVDLINDISSLTHGHVISKSCCNVYNILVQEVINNRFENDFKTLIKNGISKSMKYYPLDEYPFFERIYSDDFFNLSLDEIGSTGYVLDSLEVAIYCCYNSNSFSESVLNAINLGGDTDTNGAITGGLSAVYYGYDRIPNDWIDTIINKKLINKILDNFIESFK